VDLQPDAFTGGPLHEAGALTGRPDLSASPLNLGRRGRHRRRDPNDEQTDRAKRHSHLAHRPGPQVDQPQPYFTTTDQTGSGPRAAPLDASLGYFLWVNRVDIVMSETV
jgi:hypothetical protein